MEAWITIGKEIVLLILGHPANLIEGILVGFAGIIGLVLVLKIAGKALGIPDKGPMLRILACLATTLIIFATIASIKIYVPQAILNDRQGLAVLLVGVALSYLIIAVPLSMLILQSKFMPTALALGFAMIGAVILIILGNIAADSIYSSARESSKIMKHTREMNDEVNNETKH